MAAGKYSAARAGTECAVLCARRLLVGLNFLFWPSSVTLTMETEAETVDRLRDGARVAVRRSRTL